MSLLTSIPVPIAASNTMRKVVLTEKYLVAGTVLGWIAVSNLQNLSRTSLPTSAAQNEKDDGNDVEEDGNGSGFMTFQADRLWDIDVRDDVIVTGNENGTVGVWDAGTGNLITHLHGHSELVKHVLLPPTHPIIISGSKDSTVIIWSLTTYSHLATLTEHQTRIAAIKVFGEKLVTADGTGEIRMWDLSGIKKERELGEGEQIVVSCLGVLKPREAYVVALAMSEDGKWLFSGGTGGDIVDVSNLDTAEHIATCANDTNSLGRPPMLLQLTPSPFLPNTLLSCSNKGTIRSWAMPSGMLLRTLDAHLGKACRGFLFTEDGKLMISSGMDGRVKIWDAQTWELKGELREKVENAYLIVKCGDRMAVALLEDHTSLVEVWDLGGLGR